MGTLTLDGMKSEIRAALGNRTDLDTRLTRIINLAQMRIARIRRWEELESIYTNTTPYTGVPADDKFLSFPGNMRDIYSVVLKYGAESRKLTRFPNRVWDRQIPMPEYWATGKPSAYTLHRNVMEFWRIPDANYPLVARGVEWPVAFSDTLPDATSQLDQKDDMLIALSTSWCFMTLKDTETSRKWWSIYANMLNAAIGEEAEKPDLDQLPNPGVSGQGFSGDYWRNPWVNDILVE